MRLTEETKDKVWELSKNKDLTYAQIGKMAGCSAASVSRILFQKKKRVKTSAFAMEIIPESDIVLEDKPKAQNRIFVVFGTPSEIAQVIREASL